ncbi:alanyl-tRNA synthetase [Candidatus Nitrososphaera evergladensis SR1]|uniref:Alanine--tRNA ligase n=2 Tax=Nitrososphaera TaxID=497726 RepID=A0A075MRB0_9ARCH|nr:alanyl-tRNA synthetase [Candidatus Nitrososphaera evergladensis SR1]
MFSQNPDRYYKVALFDKIGFQRRQCNLCGKHFWTLIDRQSCPDHENYGFIGRPPTTKRLDYVNAWKETEKFFSKNGHEIVRRYPVVCRWRDDLYFTIASIVDFQRVMNNQVVFELPANPLVVPQMCLRFNDIENVGLSGRHYTGFCMIGQTCNADAPGGYWKDRCIELDYGMLTQGLGIKPEEITFVEDVWMGAGAFGYSLEYFVRGLELGNAVFTEFEGDENNYRVMKNKIIDMGAGLERFSWVTMGTPTSYDCCFGPVVEKMLDMTGTDRDSEFLSRYFGAVASKLETTEGNVRELKAILAREMGLSYDQLAKMVAPHEAVYTVADHVRTLLFAISDGALPSNVGGGYNLRVILRRALSILERLNWQGVKLEDVADMQIDYLRQMYPELEEHRQDVRTILGLESGRYSGSRERMNGIVSSLKAKKSGELAVSDLIRLYESDGITPDYLVEQGVIPSVPSTFYTKLAELHTSVAGGGAEKAKPVRGLEGLPATELLYYKDESIREFDAKVLKIVDNKFVVLDRTAFYPRGGGQEPDTGEISGAKVVEVTKQADIVVHRIEDGGKLQEGQAVKGIVNGRRRDMVTKHHTATHVINSSARNNLGSWVWQNSAFKEENYGRLDITHHSALSKEEVQKIEQTANIAVRKNLPVDIKFYDRGDAEQKYSFRIYQGGVVPSSNVRIVNIDNWDIEACGGTHVRRTGEIGMIKIVKSERIQDGVVRLEFVAGEAAVNYMQNQDAQLSTIAQALGSSREKVLESFAKAMDDAESAKKKLRIMLRTVAETMARSVSENAKNLGGGDVKLYSVYDEELDEDYHIAVGEKAIEFDPSLVYVALVAKGAGMRVIVFAGEKARKCAKAGGIAKQVSAKLGGSGGGDDRFGQGGGRLKEKINEALLSAEEMIAAAAAKKAS